MDAKTLEALKASIEKWKRNSKAKEPEDYLVAPEDCPLCALFLVDDYSCAGCPIAEKTGKNLCRGTPYVEASTAKIKWLCRKGRRATALKAADREVAFLESLRPEGERP